MSGEYMLDEEKSECDNECWYDADGNSDDDGWYDAAGHFYAERASCMADAYMDRLKEGDA
jgi:hypothetical protein